MAATSSHEDELQDHSSKLMDLIPAPSSAVPQPDRTSVSLSPSMSPSQPQNPDSSRMVPLSIEGHQVKHHKHSFVFVVILGSVGSVLEWFDFAVFGTLAPEISELFFPQGNATAALLDTLAVFAGAFLARPVGGVLFGYFGDRWSRRKSVLLAVGLMSIATTLLGCLPTFQMVGITASMLLLVIRLLQGLSVGGQLAGSFLLTIESAPPHLRGMYSGMCLTGAVCGSGLGSIVVAALREWCTKEQLLTWGWRLPFLSGCLVGFLAHGIRGYIDEPPDFEHVQQKARNPICEAITKNWREIFLCMFLALFWSTGVYVYSVWIPTFQFKVLKPPLLSASTVNAFMMWGIGAWLMIAGRIGDWIGPPKGTLRVMAAGAILGCASAIPMFFGINTGEIWPTVIAQGIFGLGCGAFGSGLGLWMVYSFPAKTRYTSVAIGYNLAQGVFGGSAPLVSAAMYNESHVFWTPGIYLSICAVVSGIALFISYRQQATHNYQAFSDHDHELYYLDAGDQLHPSVVSGSAITSPSS